MKKKIKSVIGVMAVIIAIMATFLSQLILLNYTKATLVESIMYPIFMFPLIALLVDMIAEEKIK